jgi:glycerol-3-phosphate acyltransferase PlsY
MGMEDPRQYGSGNPGATNVLRSGKKLAAALTLLGDGLKGLLAVWIARRFGGPWGVDALMVSGVALAVVLGHMWPVLFKFQGGKGVATASGVCFGLNAWLGLAVVATWLLVAWIWRYSSLAAMSALMLAPVYAHFLFAADDPAPGVILLMGVLVFYRHRGNLVKLLNHQEKKIGA